MNETLFDETRRYLLERMRGLLREGRRKLPSEKELAGEILASYATLRLVMNELEREGFIRKIRGSGSYLRPEAEDLLEMASWPRLRLFTSPLNGNVHHNYADYLVAELARHARALRYRVDIRQVRTHDEFLAGLAAEARCVDPVVYLPPTEPFTMRQLGEIGNFERIPLVVVDCELSNIHINNVATDNRRGGMLAAHALIESGCRDLVMVQSEPPLRQGLQRLQGFEETARLAGARVERLDCDVNATDDRHAIVRRDVAAFLRTGRRPDGIFVVSDAGAIAVVAALRGAGLAPGGDVALIGFDALPGARHHSPALTSVAQPIGAIGDAVFELLGRWRPGMHEQRLLAPELFLGATLPQPEISLTR